MEQYWTDVADLVEAVFRGVSAIDKTAFDLNFVFKDKRIIEQTHYKKIRKAMEDCKPRSEFGPTNILSQLERVFTEYKRRVKPGHDAELMTLLVVSDGLWHGMDGKERGEVDTMILDFIKDIMKSLSDQMHRRPFSIEFIQFGDDEAAKQMFTHLDNELVVPSERGDM
jgi:hypothetical protein